MKDLSSVYFVNRYEIQIPVMFDYAVLEVLHMCKKTISAHYGSQFSLDHDNREFIPKNADPGRVMNNLYLIAAGHVIPPGFRVPMSMSALWERYRDLCDVYWTEDREIYDEIESLTRNIIDLLYEHKRDMRELRDNPIGALLELLFLPFVILDEIITDHEIEKAKEELQEFRSYHKEKKKEFNDKRIAVRDALRDFDRARGTKLLEEMDYYVCHGCSLFLLQQDVDAMNRENHRFATIEEIYAHLYEPAFQAFQKKQRPCRRYNGTYLEQIRERQAADVKSKNKNEASRAMSEAIQVVFQIGDMKDTGYKHAPSDARKSEYILKRLSHKLLADKHICTVTTRDLEDPNWKPPFKHGLILVNLTCHFDEATPGVHATFIPYSEGCKRGPGIQPSLSRAMTGMGFPSEWEPVLGEDGNPIPKTDRNGKIIYDKDGSPRIQKKPTKQGIIDWLEKQKEWIQAEMYKDCGWEREYKGSHPRGHLSTPEYIAAQELEKLKQLEEQSKNVIKEFTERSNQIADALNASVDRFYANAKELDVFTQYLSLCSDQEYNQLLDVAYSFLDQLPQQEHEQAKTSFAELLNNAQDRASQQSDTQNSKNISPFTPQR